MAEHERDEEIGRRYRELAREEPPRALDEAILAAARRELETRPAPLVAPTGRRRWMFPVAAAAVIVLSAVVTLHVQRERPDLELASAPPPAAPPAAVKEKEEKAGPAPAAEAQPEGTRASEQKHADARIARSREEAQERRDAPRRAVGPSPASPAAKEPPAAAAAPPPQAQLPALADSAQSKAAGETRRFVPDPAAIPPAPAPAEGPPALAAQKPAPQMQQRPAPAAAPARERDASEMSRESLSRRAESTMAKSEAVAEPPERMLERIATLRREGRHKEADDLYSEFRRRFPDYRIPEAMREQVLPR